MQVINKDFSNGNIKYTVRVNDNEDIEQAIRLVEVFNDNFRGLITYLRPIGFKINGFGTENQLYASEDFTETIIEIIRKLDKYSYRFVSPQFEPTDSDGGLIPTVRIKMGFNQPTVTINNLVEELGKCNIEIKDYLDNEVIIHNLKESLTLELVFGLCNGSLTSDETSAICKRNNGTEHYLCNVAPIGGIVYSLNGDTEVKVNCDVFVSDPESIYSKTVDAIRDKLNKF